MTNEELRALADAATPGPWEWVDPETDIPGLPSDTRSSLRTTWERKSSVGMLPEFILHEVEYEQENTADAAFIAAARTEVPRLLDEVERLAHMESLWKRVASFGADTESITQMKRRIIELERERDAALDYVEAFVGWGDTIGNVARGVKRALTGGSDDPTCVCGHPRSRHFIGDTSVHPCHVLLNDFSTCPCTGYRSDPR